MSKDRSEIDGNTLIDVVATKGKEVIVKRMTFAEAMSIKKAKGWYYQNFQIGFHAFKNSPKN